MAGDGGQDLARRQTKQWLAQIVLALSSQKLGRNRCSHGNAVLY
jgi:hypothetical protein